jgi:pilus assembly protein CpaE
VVSELTQTSPAVVVLGPDLGPDEALELMRAFDAQRPDIVVVLVADPSIQLLERALRAGARDVVSPDSSDTQLREAFERALEASRRRNSVIANGESLVPARHVICVVSPKGGTGKTTIKTAR